MTTPTAQEHSSESNQDDTTNVANLDSQASEDENSLDVGANLFDVDEKLLSDTFSAFGVLITNPKIIRDPETGNSRAFICYGSFSASDAALGAMHGQYLGNRQITVSYAYKKDGKGEHHGNPTERFLAARKSSMREPTPNMPSPPLPR